VRAWRSSQDLSSVPGGIILVVQLSQAIEGGKNLMPVGRPNRRALIAALGGASRKTAKSMYLRFAKHSNRLGDEDPIR
jgi:hypothetical protein